MPSARYFRLIVGDLQKSALELSAVHLYNDNTRVDQNATLSSGFGLNATQLAPVKNDTPSSDSKIDIDLKTNRMTFTYIVWTFASAINVNAFRIGSGSSEATYLDKFALQYSDDGITYKSFVKIGFDKKLYYPGPWQLSDLKPVGECYPFVMSKADQYFKVNGAGDISLKDNYSFRSNANVKSVVSVNWGASSVGLAVLLPGIFQSGKYYFEVSCAAKNSYATNVGNSYNKYALGLFKDPTERMDDVRNIANKGPSICINHPAAANANTPTSEFTYNWDYSPVVGYKTFKAGIQHGLAIDLDNRTMKVVNPTYANVDPGIYDITRANISTDMAAGDKVKMAITIAPSYGGCTYNDDVSVNFGQAAFSNSVPAGYQPGFGPRWREVPDNFIAVPTDIGSWNKSGSADYALNGDVPELIIGTANTISGFERHNGHFFIKGTISRVPNIQNKRFVARLYCHSNNQFVATCVASPTGLYEFYGIAYDLYSIFSVDVTTNTVTEAIGPVYPMEIV